jgi:hypothetical protein
MGLIISHLGCLDNTLVIPVKDQVDMGVEMRMKMMICSRCFLVNSPQPLVGDG